MTEKSQPPQPEPLRLGEAFQLNEMQRDVLEQAFADEQLFAQLGIRGLVTGAASGDMTEFRRAAAKLRAILVTQFNDGYDRAREDSFPALCAYALGGAAGGAVITLLVLWLL